MTTTAPSSATSAPTTEATAPPTSTAATSAPEAPAAPTPVEDPEPFQLGDWDGDPQSLPEEFREFGLAFHGYYQPQFSKRDQQIAELQQTSRQYEAAVRQAEQFEQLYRALSDGSEDPRVAQYAAERDALKAEYEGFKTQIEQEREAEARSLWNDWSSKHPHLVSNQVSRMKIGEMLNAGVDLDLIPEVFDLSKKDLEEFQTLVGYGTPPAKALSLAKLQAEVNSVNNSKSPSPALVNGAEDPSGNPAALDRGEYRKLSYDERLERAVLKYSRKG
jgi:hypothetical protein